MTEQSYQVIIQDELPKSNLPSDLKAKIRGFACMLGCYQDDNTAEWEMSDNQLMTLIHICFLNMTKEDF